MTDGLAGSALRRPRPRTLGAILILLVVAGTIAAVIGLRPKPVPTTVPPPPAAALIVSVAHAGEPVVNQGFPTTLTVRALGAEPIASIELWLGAKRLADAANVGGSPAQVARWAWTPAVAGPAVLVARATDVRGREAQSAPIRLTVEASAPRYQPVRPVVAEAGESAIGVAIRAGGGIADLTRWNAGLDPVAPLEAGTVVYVGMAVREVPRPDVADEIQAVTGAAYFNDDTAAGAGTVGLASWTGAGPAVSPGPPAAGASLFVPPKVDASVVDCTIKLAVSSGAANATGLGVYGLGPTSSAFAQVATFGTAAPATFSAPAAGGAYLFSVSTYDAAVEEQGDLVAVDVPAGCGEPGWTGEATLSRGRLTVGSDVDRAYLYMSRDGGPWRRLPADPSAFVERLGGELDFSPYLPADLATTAVDIEAWGWKGAGLLPLGSGHQEPAAAAGSAPPGPVGGGGGANLWAGGTFTELDWVRQQIAPGSKELQYVETLVRDGSLSVWTSQGAVKADLTEDFRWLTNAAGVDSLVWQVAAFPMSPDLAPDTPGVLLQQVVPLTDGTKGGDFPIDIRPIFAPPAATGQVGDVLAGGLVEKLNLGQFQALATSTPAPLASPATASKTAVYSPGWLLEKFTPSVLYVRAIPMDGPKVVAGVSNFVKISVVGDDAPTFDPSATFAPGPQPTPGPSGPKPYSLFLQFLPPANANPEFADCVLVTGFEANATPDTLALKEGDFFCRVYSNTSGGWTQAGAFEHFVDAVASAWDAVTSAWSWLQEQLASAIAKYSGCSAIAGGGFCEGLAKVAISVALSSVGIPPSLPNTKDLVALGKGELKDALVDLASKAAMSTLGYNPCDAAYLASKGLGTDSCDAIADQLLNDLVAKLDALKTEEAKAITGVQVPFGVNVVPHPWGTLRPPRFRVTIARNTAIPLPATGECRMTLSMGSVVKDWTHKAYNEQTKTWWTVTETVSGAPFAALTVAIPDPSKAEGAIELPALVPKDASIYQKLLAALNNKVLINRDYYLTETAFWREANNPGQIYVPGQGYISFVDHDNRAWVLLQNGAGVIAHITRAPYAADCFDPVVAFGVIPLVDQGYPCVPSYGWWWETIKHPFDGTPAQQFACSIMYHQSVGY